MTITRFRSLAALSVAGLAAAALPMMTAGTADAATSVKDQKFNYGCDTTAGGVPLGVKQVGVTPSFTIPSLYKGQTVPKTKVGIALTLPEDLRSATADLLGGKKVSGSSDDAVLNVTANDQNLQFPIANLKATDQPVPQKKNAAWVIKTTGTSPAIPVPAVDSLTLGMPTQFTIKATIKGDNPDAPVTMKCALQDASNTIKTVSVRNKTTLTATTSPKTIKAKKTTPYVSVTAKSTTTPTGTVAVYKGTKKLGAGKLAKGKVKVKLAKFTKKGKVTLTIKYAGDKTAVDTSITKSVTVK